MAFLGKLNFINYTRTLGFTTLLVVYEFSIVSVKIIILY